MLAKITTRAPVAGQRQFGIINAGISKVFNTIDRSTQAYNRAKYDPTRPLEVSCNSQQGHEPIIIEAQETQLNSTYLSNGFTVVTENSKFPSTVNMGKNKLK